MYNLKIISSTVRPGRKGPIIAAWIAEKAKQDGNFNVEVLDLGEINLPMMNEVHHPIMKKYEHEHTKNWSAKIEEADAFIFVTDGITESRNSFRQEFSEDRLLTLIENNYQKSAEEIRNIIIDEVNDYTNGVEQFDDMTVVVVKAIDNKGK